jgi:hypothetical protein
VLARVVLGAIAAAIIGVAIWSAWPSTTPRIGPTLVPSPPSAGPGPPTPIRPHTDPQAAAATHDDPAPPADLDARVAGCLDAQRRVAGARAARGAPAPAGQPSDAAVVARGCAPLYHDAGCRDAMLRFDEPPPAERSRAVLQVCARAYCGLLAAPKPSVCAHVDAVPEDEQQFAAWNELRRAILTHDIGAAAAERVLSPPAR